MGRSKRSRSPGRSSDALKTVGRRMKEEAEAAFTLLLPSLDCTTRTRNVYLCTESCKNVPPKFLLIFAGSADWQAVAGYSHLAGLKL